MDMMCGSWGAARCSPAKWFGFMGDKNNLYVPFPINYTSHAPDGYIPFGPRIVPCSEAVNVSETNCNFISNQMKNIYPITLKSLSPFCCSVVPFQSNTLPCACTDCEQSCPKPQPLPPAPKPFVIVGLDGYFVIMFFVFIVLSALFLFGVCLYASKEPNGK